ncbi:MAG: bifunctional (p)ppGpp synthetase/guanosine-3',5'-bis(diphosphate) 3'-pyrophosphohydrolase [Deltaproteobacteria bacterium]|nr:bifunctional (p)ppGpp synthetase/guanosine-3',5'-bis(diphosphate) 3'-pyrophosphohydrolase [Deltaproteobacteria bacterium]
MPLSEILAAVRVYAPDADCDGVERAWALVANQGPEATGRALARARILTGLRMDVEAVAAGLLVGVPGPVAAAGPVVAGLVESVARLERLRFERGAAAQAENYRKMVLALSRDVRAVILHLAERLRILKDPPPEADRRAVAEETLEVQAPLADRLGLGLLKEEMEDLCLRHLHPEVWQALDQALARFRIEREPYVARTSARLGEMLRARGISCEISGRAKGLLSIHRKMIKQGIPFEQVHDVIAFRILVDDVRACYEVLGHIHGMYAPVPGRIKDFIAVAKPNGYQSLHTTVYGPEGQRIEIQIRTHEMHRIAQDGIAAHWRYKQGRLDVGQEELQQVARLRRVMDAARQVRDAGEFLDTVRTDLLSDRVFVLTPGGEVKALPSGATVLDFAYAIHTELGHHCTGARVDGRMVSLRHELVNGVTVEVVTRSDQRPSRDWLGIARTGRALSKIRRAVRAQERERAVELGRSVLAAECRRVGLVLARLVKDGRLKAVAREHGLREADDLLADLGLGRLPASRVAREMAPAVDTETPAPEIPSTAPSRAERPVLIHGEEDVLVSYAGCCRPLPGEPVMGFITRGRGITVHRADCPQLLGLPQDRRIPVEWDPRARAVHGGEIQVTCTDRPGILTDIARQCTDMGVHIASAEARPAGGGRGVVHLEVAVGDVSELRRLIRRIERIRGVSRATRVKG